MPSFESLSAFLLLFLGLSAGAIFGGTARPAVVDADTGNEMDDLYAIVHAVLSPEIEVLGLTSAHFNNVQLLTDERWHIYPTEGIDPIRISQELNEELLDALGRREIPHPLGADRMVGYAWGYYEGAPVPDAPAIDFIIEQARAQPAGERLDLLILGPVTNATAAILKAPDIASKIRCHLLSMRYDFEQGAWDKNEFNARNDINGIDLLFENPEVEMVVMPANVARQLTFRHQASLERLTDDHPVVDILRRRWAEVDAGPTWIMWDLALVEAFADPSVATLTVVPAPPENGGRPIALYRDIDAEAVEARFWSLLEAWLEDGE